MLTIIAGHKDYAQLPVCSTAMPPFHSLTNVPFFNAVGKLQNLCLHHHLVYPEYILIGNIGPSHIGTFTIRCKVLNFEEDGQGYTKKQAKHDAAKKKLL